MVLKFLLRAEKMLVLPNLPFNSCILANVAKRLFHPVISRFDDTNDFWTVLSKILGKQLGKLFFRFPKLVVLDGYVFFL